MVLNSFIQCYIKFKKICVILLNLHLRMIIGFEDYKFQFIFKLKSIRLVYFSHYPIKCTSMVFYALNP